MTTVLQRLPIDRIGSRAREIKPGRVVLTLLTGVFFTLGWAVGKVWLLLVWAVVAVNIGWQEARKAQSRGPRR